MDAASSPTFHNPILDPQPLAISICDLPKPLRLSPDRPQSLRALPQVRFVEGDAHVDDVVVLPPWLAPARRPRHGLDHELHGLQAPACAGIVDVAHADEALAIALDELAGAGLPRPQGEAG